MKLKRSCKTIFFPSLMLGLSVERVLGLCQRHTATRS